MHHILGNKVLEYDVDDRGVIVDEREIDRTVNHKPNIAGTYKQTGANMSLFLSDNNNKTRFGSMAFYKSILFDSVPTKENDGFTEQDLIDYVLENLITK